MRGRDEGAPPRDGAGPSPTPIELEERLADVDRLRVQAAGDADAWRAACDELRRELEAARSDLRAAESDVARLRPELHAATAKLRATEAALQGARAALEQLSTSRSWRLTAPLRAASARLRRGTDAAPPAAAAATDAAVAPNDARTGAPVADVARALAESGLFDRAFYLARYPDVAASGIEPLEHFAAHGALERRDPNDLFDTGWYLERDPSIAASGQNPVLHYLAEGARQGKDPGPGFSTTRYLELNPDVAAAGLNPLAHYLTHGRAEGRVAPPSTAVAAPATRPADPLPRLARVARGPIDPRGILVIDAQVPTPDRDSGSVRMRAILELLVELGWQVSFVSHDPAPRPDDEAALTQRGIEVLRGPDAARAHLQEHGGRHRAVWLSRPAIFEMYGAVARAHAVRADLVYDSVDLHWIRHLRAFELSGDPQERQLAEHFQRLESFAITTADRVIAITDAEQRTIEERWPGTRTALLPNVHEVRPLAARFVERDGLLFIGNYAHPPNVDAMTWFVEAVLPLVRRDLPGARLRIVGAGASDRVRSLASEAVEVVGWVREADPQFGRARVFVCPLRYGAGMKGKIGQAMSLGTPVVTTTIGAEGMQLVPGIHALVEDDPAAFAAAVVRLYRDEPLWCSLRDAAAAHVEARLSRAAARRVLADLLGSPAARPAGAGVPG